MKLKIFLPSLAASCVMLAPSPSFAQAITKGDADHISFFCPVPDLPGLDLGAVRSPQDQGVIDGLANLNKLPPRFRPFTEADLEITPWSQRLAGVTYLASAPDDPTHQAWSDALAQSLTDTGWAISARKDLASPPTSDAIMFEKVVETRLGPRTILVAFATPGALMLRCGDIKLLEIQKMERNGQLEPNSTRPTKPANLDMTPMPKEKDCFRRDVRAAFRQVSMVDELPATRAFVTAGAELSEHRLFGERLITWLQWKLLSSGLVDSDKLWQLREPADSQYKRQMVSGTMGIFSTIGNVTKAQVQNDPSKICKSLIKVITATAEKDRIYIAHHSKVVELLEQEARRLGVAID